jgi:hypothetical protein
MRNFLTAALFAAVALSSAPAARQSGGSPTDGLTPPYVYLNIHQVFTPTGFAPAGSGAGLTSTTRGDSQIFETRLDIDGFNLAGQTLALYLVLGDGSTPFVANITFQTANSRVTLQNADIPVVDAISEFGIEGVQLRLPSGETAFAISSGDQNSAPDIFTSIVGLEVIPGAAGPGVRGTAVWKSVLTARNFQASLDAALLGLPGRAQVTLTGNGSVGLGDAKTARNGKLRIVGGWSQNLRTGAISPYGPRSGLGVRRLPASFEILDFQSLAGANALGQTLFSFALALEALETESAGASTPGSGNYGSSGTINFGGTGVTGGSLGLSSSGIRINAGTTLGTANLTLGTANLTVAGILSGNAILTVPNNGTLALRANQTLTSSNATLNIGPGTVNLTGPVSGSLGAPTSIVVESYLPGNSTAPYSPPTDEVDDGPVIYGEVHYDASLRGLDLTTTGSTGLIGDKYVVLNNHNIYDPSSVQRNGTLSDTPVGNEQSPVVGPTPAP